MFNIKAISPVVATALLLVISVVSVVSFQSWFESYSSSLFVGAEEDSSIDNFNLGVEGIFGDELYVNAGSSLNITRVTIDGNECSLVMGSITGVQDLNISDCINQSSTSTPVVVIYTDNQIISKKVYVKDLTAVSELSTGSSLDCSSVGPGSWIEVPAYPLLGITDSFCVMQFEAKFVNGTGKTVSLGSDTWDGAPGDKNITSTTLGNPIATINQTDAIGACQGLGSGYDLISNVQWMAIARDAEVQAANWDGSGIYDGTMPRGHSDSGPGNALIVSDINDPYDQTGNSSLLGFNQRRTLNLSNGEVIWDLGGNVFELNRDTINCSGGYGVLIGTGYGCSNMPYNSNDVDSNWHQFTEIDYYGSLSELLLKSINTSLDSTHGIGQIYTDNSAASPSGTTHAFLRGGEWSNRVNAGPFALILSNSPSFSGISVGFRCSYAP